MSSSTRPQSTSIPAADSKKRKDRSFLGKLKDKTIGTKEEREAESRRRHEMVIHYAIGQLRPDADFLRRIVFVWKRSDSVPRR